MEYFGSASMTVLIRPFLECHLRQVMKIDRLVYPTHWSRTVWLGELSKPERIYLVALADGAVVGYIGAAIFAEDVHVMTVATHPNRQHCGIGTRLMLEIVSRAVSLGCSAMTLEVRSSNSAAQALYRRFGMSPAGIRRGYYKSEKEDALVMWVHEIHGAAYLERLDKMVVELESVV